jgi:hypothetical protein
MDLNYLYHRQGMSTLMAASAACERSREAHRGLAAGYADQIARVIRSNRGADDARGFTLSSVGR